VIDRLLIDAHVHVHDCYDEAAFLHAAYGNLSRHGPGMPTLLLAEMPGFNTFSRWRSGNAAWPVKLTDEPVSLILGEKLLVIAGRQIVTAERVEVLALLSDQLFDDGQPLDKTITCVRDAGAVALLPWGAGKWSGKRGRLVGEAAVRHSVLLGDSAGRPIGWPAPSIFQRHVVLRGSDPLRMASQQFMVGRYGFALSGAFDIRRPAEGIHGALRLMMQSPPSFGQRVGPIQFLRQQVELRFKHTGLRTRWMKHRT